MKLADHLTVMILTFNEEPNIARTLDALKWAKRILVIDSGSTDSTLEIVGRYEQCQLARRTFDTFAGQCNYGLGLIATDWVLSIDADYEVSTELAKEIQGLPSSPSSDGFFAGFTYCIHGKPLRASVYPPRCVLYRKAVARYHDEGHGHRVSISGTTARLSANIRHDDRKPLSRWFDSQRHYAHVEASHLLSAPRSGLSRIDRLRLLGWLAPPLMFVYVMLVKRCMLDGWAGWFYALQRTLAETMLALEIIERRSLTGTGNPCDRKSSPPLPAHPRPDSSRSK